jgi:hypothetical protein
MRFNSKIVLLLLVGLFVGVSSLAFISSADQKVIVNITSIQNVGNNLEVNASFTYENGTHYVGSVALKSTAPPGYQPSTQDWEYIPDSGNKTFLIQNRGLQDYDSITVYAEPWEQYNASWYGNDTWGSPLDNTTVNQSISNNSNGSVDVNVDVNVTPNNNVTNTTNVTNVTVNVVVTNSTSVVNNNTIIIPITNGSGSGQITINNLSNGDSVQTTVPGSFDNNSYDPYHPENPITGYKSVSNTIKNDIVSPVNYVGVPMQPTAFPLMIIFNVFLFLGSSLLWFRK